MSARNVGEAAIKIVADGSEFESGLSKSTDNAGKSVGTRLANALGTTLKAGAAAAGAAAAGVIGTALVQGFKRLDAIDQATEKLKGLGHSAEAVATISNNALASVRGTAYGLGDAMSQAAVFVASGIKPGQDLERTMKTLANTTAIAGTSLSDVGAIFTKIATTGKLTGETLGQLQERGVPVLKFLADQYGVTLQEAQRMVSEGKVSFEEFQQALDTNIGQAALATGNTFKGAMENVKAALGRVGAAFLGPAFKQLAPFLKSLIPLIDDLAPVATRVGEVVGRVFGTMLSKVTEFINYLRTGDLSKVMSQFFSILQGGNNFAAEGVPWAAPFVNAAGIVRTVLAELRGGITAFGAAWKANDGTVTSSGFPGFMEKVANVLRKVTDVIGPILPQLLAMGGAVLGFTAVSAKLGPAVSGFMKLESAGKAVTLLQGALGRLAFMTGPIGLVVVALTALFGMTLASGDGGAGIAAVIDMISNGLQSLVGAIPGIVAGIASALPAIVNAFVSVIQMLVPAIVSLVPVLINAFVQLVMAVAAMLPTLIPVLLNGAIQLLMALVQAAVTILPVLIQAVVQLVQMVAAMLPVLIPLLIQAALQLFMSIVEAIPVVLPQILQGIITLVMAIVSLLPTLIPALLNAAISLLLAIVQAVPVIVPQLISAAITLILAVVELLPTLIPQLLNAAIQLLLAIVNAIPVIIPALINGAIQLIMSVVKMLPTLIPALLSAAVQLFMAIVKAIPQILGALISATHELYRAVASTLIAAAPQMLQAGKDMMQGLINGIRNMAGAVRDAAMNVARSAMDGIKSFLKLGSPSKLAKQYGEWTGEGLGIGLKESTKGVVADAKRMVSKVAATLNDPKVMLTAFGSPTIDFTGSVSGPSNPLSSPDISSTSRTPGNQTSVFNVTISVDDLDKISKVSDFVAMLDGARNNYRRGVGSTAMGV